MSESGDDRVGTRLGKYRLERVLGRGGMGVVFESHDSVLDRRVAIKLLPAGPTLDEATRQWLLREARSAARLNHPNVVAVYEADELDGTFFLVMELVPGGSAEDRLRSLGRLPWAEASRCVADACRGLAAAHAVGLLHRDIKPANILCGAAGEYKLADFGLARDTDRSNASVGVAGTPAFMSPEQCRSEPADERGDIYSLGATYYTLLTGRPPFTGRNAMAVMYAHCSTPTPDPREAVPDLPDACVEIVRTAMAKQASRRYQDAATMLAHLESLVDQTGSFSAIPHDRTEPLPRRRGRGRGAVMVIGALFFLAAVAVGAWYLTRPRDEPKRSPIGEIGGGEKAPVATQTPFLIFDAGAAIDYAAFQRDDAPDKRRIVTIPVASSAVPRIWSLARDKLPDHETMADPQFGPIGFSTDNGLYLGRPDGVLEVRNGPGRPVKTRFNRAQVGGSIRTMAFSSEWGDVRIPGRTKAQVPTPKWLALIIEPTGSARGAIRLMKLNTSTTDEKLGSILPEFDFALPACAAFAQGSPVLAVGCADGIVRLWDSAKNEPRHDVGAPGDAIRAIAFLHDDRLVLARDNQIELWAIDGAADSRMVADGVKPIKAIAVSERNALAWAIESEVHIWDAALGKEVAVLPVSGVRVLTFDERGDTLLTAGEDGKVRLWDVSGYGGRKPRGSP